MVNNNDLDVVIDLRLLDIFTAFQQGKDVSPAVLYRHEGLIDAACLMGLLTVKQAQGKIINCWSQVFDEPFPELPEDTISIPMAMARAPVYPSTKD